MKTPKSYRKLQQVIRRRNLELVEQINPTSVLMAVYGNPNTRPFNIPAFVETGKDLEEVSATMLQKLKGYRFATRRPRCYMFGRAWG